MRHFFLFFFGLFLHVGAYAEHERAEGRDCTISRLLVKQIIDPDPVKQMSLVCDVTACSIAQHAGIPANHVALVSYNKSFFGKNVDGFPATVHLNVPGIPVNHLPQFDNFSLYQKIRPVGSWMYNEWGPLAPGQTGITLKIIRDMSLHDDLPLIVALDTFVGNRDRSNPNLFYDEAEDRFYAIDFGESFKYNLSKEALAQFRRLARNGYQFSQEERHALRLFAQTMEQLVQHFSAQRIIKMFTQYAYDAGFRPGSPLYTAAAKERIKFYITSIRECVKDSKLLVECLFSILSCQK